MLSCLRYLINPGFSLFASVIQEFAYIICPLLLLLSRFSCVRLLATPWTAAY